MHVLLLGGVSGSCMQGLYCLCLRPVLPSLSLPSLSGELTMVVSWTGSCLRSVLLLLLERDQACFMCKLITAINQFVS